jgi:hypothetical protein
VSCLLRALVACLLLAASAAAEEPVPGGKAQFATILPGREQPAAPAPVLAYRFRWDDYVTLVVIADEGQGLRRPAWVVTYDRGEQVVVGYRATAFADGAGNVHIDARKAIIAGPKREEWSPDSFAFTRDGKVLTIDDANRANTGELIETTLAGQGDVYRTLLGIAMAIVREIS